MSAKRIIIIGATSGIGKEMASIFLSQGHKVGITGRRRELLDELAAAYPGQAVASCFDVMEAGSCGCLDVLVGELGGMDIFIYNSGYGEISKELDAAVEMTTTKTNVNGFVELVSHAFRYFVNQGSGQIALISSVAALRGNSWAPSYSASKAFMSNYAEGLNIKAGKMKKDIVVTDIKPGFVDTKMAQGNGRFWVATPQKAARQIVKAIGKRKRTAYITKRWWLVGQVMKLLPYGIYRRIA
jgi:short-subunit dehydrogenase